MEKQINERYIKFSGGKIPVDTEIKLGDEFVLTMRVACVQERLSDNNDGTADKTSIMKPTEGVELEARL